MITKSGIDTKNFEYPSAGVVNEALYMSYTAKTPTGIFALTNKNGMEVCITNVGGRIVSCLVPDKDGNFVDVILGFDTLADYLDYNQRHENVQGAIVGRYAGRITNAKFNINGKESHLPQNAPGCCLHGGPYGWAFQTFEVLEHNAQSLKLHLTSPDGDMGFPGKVELDVVYTLTDDNALQIDYAATSDAPTPINVTNHSYFNLSGDHNNTILNDRLFINAWYYAPLDEQLCTKGTIEKFEHHGVLDFYGKRFFRSAYYKVGKRIGDDIEADDIEIKIGNGYDHCYALQSAKETHSRKLPFYNRLPIAAKAHSPISGVILEIFTDQPAVQFYDSADLDGSLIGKKGIPLNKRCGLCLETQHFPNSPNVEAFPSTILSPGQKFCSSSVYKFSKE